MKTSNDHFTPPLLHDLEGSDCIVLSDTHLLASQPHDINLFCFALEKCAESVPLVILLGDIFDFIFGYGEFHRSMYKPVFEALKKAKKSGCRVLWFEGNHEFSLQGLSQTDLVDVVKSADLITEFPSLGSKKVMLSHGDEIYASQKYLRYRNFIKSPVFQNFARFLPKKALDRVALRLSEKSRLQDEYRDFDLRSCIHSLARYAVDHGCSTIVSGHFHFLHTGTIEISGQSIQVLCQPSWQAEARGFLRLHQGIWTYVSLANRP